MCGGGRERGGCGSDVRRDEVRRAQELAHRLRRQEAFSAFGCVEAR